MPTIYRRQAAVKPLESEHQANGVFCGTYGWPTLSYSLGMGASM